MSKTRPCFNRQGRESPPGKSPKVLGRQLGRDNAVAYGRRLDRQGQRLFRELVRRMMGAVLSEQLFR